MNSAPANSQGWVCGSVVKQCCDHRKVTLLLDLQSSSPITWKVFSRWYSGPSHLWHLGILEEEKDSFSSCGRAGFIEARKNVPFKSIGKWRWQKQRNRVLNILFLHKGCNFLTPFVWVASVLSLQTEPSPSERPLTVGFLRNTPWLLPISLKRAACLSLGERLPPQASGIHCSPSLTPASWAFSLIHPHFRN